jgi:hypothetical protein
MIALLLATELAISGVSNADSLPCALRGSQHWLATRASPADSVELSVGGVRAKICYSRPHARGRSVYDSLAPFGKVWRTGANEPTTLNLSDSLRIGDVVLAPGRFVLLSVPDSTRWMILFHTADGTDPARMFQSLREVARTYAHAAVATEHVERFTITVDGSDHARAFVFAWGAFKARLPVRSAAAQGQPNEIVVADSVASEATDSLRSPVADHFMPCRQTPGVSWRLIGGVDTRTFEQLVNAQPQTCRRHLLVS